MQTRANRLGSTEPSEAGRQPWEPFPSMLFEGNSLLQGIPPHDQVRHIQKLALE